LFIELDWQRIDKAFRNGRPMEGLRVALWDAQGNLHLGVTAAPIPEPNPIARWLAEKGATRMLTRKAFGAGEEFVTSVQEAANIDTVVVLGDRDFGISVRRLAEASTQTDMLKVLEADKVMTEMMKQEIPALNQWGKYKRPSKEDIEDFVESMKKQEMVDKMMGIFRIYAPAMYTAMVGERDEYMARGLHALEPFQTTVAVMGLAHVTGVTKNLESMGWQRMPVQSFSRAARSAG
jgi:pheromone shutdown protein TraB